MIDQRPAVGSVSRIEEIEARIEALERRLDPSGADELPDPEPRIDVLEGFREKTPRLRAWEREAVVSERQSAGGADPLEDAAK